MSTMQTQTGSFQLNSDHPVETNDKDTSTFTSVNFPTPFPVGSQVVVFPMVQTFNGHQTPGIRIADVTTTGFKIRFNELAGFNESDLSDGKHVNETLGWVAYTI